MPSLPVWARVLLAPLVGILSAGASGCARDARPATAPAAAQQLPFPAAHPAWGPSPSYPASAAPLAQPADRAITLEPGVFPVSLVGGYPCVQALHELGVRFDVLPGRPGIETPIVVRGPLGGVSYWSHGGPFICDCRLALALAWVGPRLREVGIVRARFSGAYVLRTSRAGRLSYHAYGLAIDLHDFESTSGPLVVKKHFVRGLTGACATRQPALNRLSCTIEQTHLFGELLTPDYNRAHHDHFHLGVQPPKPLIETMSALLLPKLEPKRPAVKDTKVAGRRTGTSALAKAKAKPTDTNTEEAAPTDPSAASAPNDYTAGPAADERPATPPAVAARGEPPSEITREPGHEEPGHEEPGPPPINEAPVDETPVDETPVDEAPAEEAPADEHPANRPDEPPADEPPADEPPADEAPADETPTEPPSDDPGEGPAPEEPG